MTELLLFKDKCDTVFALNGTDENSATYALGWTLHKSPALLRALASSCLKVPPSIDTEQVSINLQNFGSDKGYTDIEIKHQSCFHLIFEAKKGWVLPGRAQLEKYVSRFKNDHGAYENNRQVLISLSAASDDYGERNLDPDIEGYPLIHFSWQTLVNLLHSTMKDSKSRTEKYWLKECAKHLKGYISMTSPINNLAYCVVLADKNIGSDDYTWADVVEKDRKYFHPVGGNYPKIPPNYIAFRKGGELLSVHHIDTFDVVNNLNSVHPKWPETNLDHYVYDLGSPMKPTQTMKNGGIHNVGRYWCALDTLLSGDCKTIKDARDETERRGK